MRVTLVGTAPADITVDALAVPVATGQRLSGSALDLDRALGGLLSELLTNAEFKGRIHEVLPVPTNGRIAARRVILGPCRGQAEDKEQGRKSRPRTNWGHPICLRRTSAGAPDFTKITG